MSLNKSESGINTTQFICRLVKELPSGKVTSGSGCLVLRSQSGSKPSAHLITTTQAVTINHTLEKSLIFVQFMDGLEFKLELESKDIAGPSYLIPGRVLEDKEDKEGQVSFLSIPVSRFDTRMWFKKIWKPLEKRAIQCSHSSDEALKTSLSVKHIFCNVITDDRKVGGFYITEPSYINFVKDTREFALYSITDGDYATPLKSIDDFSKDEKIKGAPLLDAHGRFVGMLAVANSGEHEIYPVFLPTLTSERKAGNFGKEKISNTDEMPLQNPALRPQPGEENKDSSGLGKVSPPKQCGSEGKGKEDITSEKLGSASPPSSPFPGCSSNASKRNSYAEEGHQQVEPQISVPPDNGNNNSEESMHNGFDEDGNQNKHQNIISEKLGSASPPSSPLYGCSSNASKRNSSAEEQNQGHQQVEPQISVPPDNGNNNSEESKQNDFDRDGNQNKHQNNHNSLLPEKNAHMRLAKDSLRNGSAGDINQDQQQGSPQGSPEPERGSESLAEEENRDQPQGNTHIFTSKNNSNKKFVKATLSDVSAEMENQDQHQDDSNDLPQPDNGNEHSSEKSMHSGADEGEDENQQQNNPDHLPTANNAHMKLSKFSVRNGSAFDRKQDQQHGISQSLPELHSGNESSSEGNPGYGSVEEEDQDLGKEENSAVVPDMEDQQVDNSQSLHSQDNANNDSSLCKETHGEPSNFSAAAVVKNDTQGGQHSVKDNSISQRSSWYESDCGEYSSIPPDDQDEHEGYSYNFSQPSSTHQSSLQDTPWGSLVSVPIRNDPHISSSSHFQRKDYTNKEGSQKQKTGVKLRSSEALDAPLPYSDCDYQGDPKGYEAGRGGPLPHYDLAGVLSQRGISNQPSNTMRMHLGSEEDPNENVVAMSGLQRRSPSQYATQNSFHEQQPEESACSQSEVEDLPYPRAVSDPTPTSSVAISERRQRGGTVNFNLLQQRMERTVQRSISEVPVLSPSTPTCEIDMTPRTRHLSVQLQHVTAGSLVKEVILLKTFIMDVICLNLDRSPYPKPRSANLLIQHWQHLADFFQVDEDIKSQCANYSILSPSEAMFEYLYVTQGSLKCETLKGYLMDPPVERKDVVNELKNDVDLLDDATLRDLYNDHPETLWKVCLKLDDKQSVRHWYHLGLKIGIDGRRLCKFKYPSRSSPSMAVLKKIKTVKPRLPLRCLQKNLEDLEDLVPAIDDVLSNISAADSESTIKTLLDDQDTVEKLTAILDLEENAWRRLGKLGKMTTLQLDSLLEESPPSPTQLLMEHIVAKNPNLNMKSFLEGLAYIGRADVIDELRNFFFDNNIDDIMSLANITQQDNISQL